MNDAEFYVTVEGGGRFSYRKGQRGCQVLPGTFGLTAVNATRLPVGPEGSCGGAMPYASIWAPGKGGEKGGGAHRSLMAEFSTLL